ncbi:MAG: helix-turn-helix domain-containing protein [Porticoccaceae bacterium]
MHKSQQTRPVPRRSTQATDQDLTSTGAPHAERPDGSLLAAADALMLLTVDDVARRLRVSQRAVRRWIAEGRLPAVHLGRAVRVRPADLARIIAVGLPQ